MGLHYTPQTVTPETYQSLWERECRQEYAEIDRLEARLGVAVDRAKVNAAARVLSCPFKAKSPNWQNGRVLYALTRSRLESCAGPVHLLDIGTAKGFSALCLQWALLDADCDGRVVSVDVMDPADRVRRNTVAECDSLRTLYEILEPWPEAGMIRFERSTGRGWLKAHRERVHVASVDGKHSYEDVSEEAEFLSATQEPGDVIFFDDIQFDGVRRAVKCLRGYDVEPLTVIPGIRVYAIARKR